MSEENGQLCCLPIQTVRLMLAYLERTDAVLLYNEIRRGFRPMNVREETPERLKEEKEVGA